MPTELQCCHQAGDIEWSPDGTLYLSTGDTGMSETRPDWEVPEDRLEAFKARHNLKDVHWSRRWIKYADVREVGFVNDSKEDRRNMPYQVSLPAKRFVNIKTFDQLTNTAPISMELGPDGSLYVAEFDGFWDAGPNAKVTRYRWVTDKEE